MEQERNHFEDWFGPGDFRADYPEPAPPQEIVTEEMVDAGCEGIRLHNNAAHCCITCAEIRAALLAVIPKLKERLGHE